MRSYLPALLVLLAPCLALHRLTREEQFERFKQKFGKEYNSGAEERLRFDVFSANVAAVESHNAARTSSYTRGINQWSDLTQEEWEAAFLGGYKRMGPAKNTAGVKATAYEVKDLPANVDWRDEGVISAVKNQGQCGSCWAFGTTEQIEAYTAIASGNLVELSAQQVPEHPWKSQLFSRLHPVPQTPSTVVAMEVARVQPLPLLTATSNFLDRFYLSPFPV